MQVSYKDTALTQLSSDLGVAFLFTGTKSLKGNIAALDSRAKSAIKKLIAAKDAPTKFKETRVVLGSGAPVKRLLVVGLGKKSEFTLDKGRVAAAVAVGQAKRLGVSNMTLLIPEQAGKDLVDTDLAEVITEGVILGNYTFDNYKPKAKPTKLKRVYVHAPGHADKAGMRLAVQSGVSLAESSNFARDLANTPGNDLPPLALAKAATEMAKELGRRVTAKVFTVPELKKMNAGGILAVGMGSHEPPCMIVVTYKGPKREDGDTAPTCLVGKGVTFDTGGISIKPSNDMDKMKYDMHGAATMLGAIRAAALLELPGNIIAIIPSAENMPGSKAQRPGDIITMMSGLTVEVLNTDAEGRLILADALHYATTLKPRVIIDSATLTGACEVALGSHAIGMLGTDDGLMGELREAGENAGERVWQLPLWDEYFEQIKATFADIQNIGGRGGGTITAAAFLRRFVDDTPWAHLDIAGTAWETKGRPQAPRGATGIGVRLLARYLRSNAN